MHKVETSNQFKAQKSVSLYPMELLMNIVTESELCMEFFA